MSQMHQVGGAVVTWGDPACGGDASLVHGALQEGVAWLLRLNSSAEVLQVCGTYGSFAAVKQDGTVVTWGKDSTGGDSSSVQPVVFPLHED